MDAIDKRILMDLLNSCRTSFSQLAIDNNLSIDNLETRIKRLVNSRTITKFTVVLNPLLLHLKETLIVFRSLTPLDANRLTLLGIHSAIEYISLGTAHEGFSFARYSSKKDLTELNEHWQQFHKTFEELQIFPVEPLFPPEVGVPTQDIVSLEKLDWLILAHVREQGRLPLQELSNRIEFDVRKINERFEYLRLNNMILETIQFNPVHTAKETLTLFQCEFTILNHLILKEIVREINTIASFWPSCSWKALEKSKLFLGFYCSSYTEVEKVQTQLSDLPGLKSVEKIMGGIMNYFPDIRDELVEEKRSHGWFAPEKWITNP
ncbi:MAG: Lrp/AsnC family transcriptional regulator [Candidatus Hodarchaeales archaeon]|jgi:DNA-binding Lrp family transcriptional regulator